MTTATENTENKNMTPPGHYVGRAIYRSPDDAVFGESSNNTPQVGLSFKITEGPFANRTFPWYGSFAEGDATRITIESLKAAGARFETDDITNLAGLGEVDCTLVIEHRVVQMKGEDGNLVDKIDERTGQPLVLPQIRYINPMGGARMKNTYDSDAKAAFRDMMRGTMAKYAKSGSSELPTDANGKALF